ncbi:MAG: hypothetical protein RR957_02630, partial [Oscillospiraceae bacterium]
MAKLTESWKEDGKIGIESGEDFGYAMVKIPGNYNELNYSEKRKKDVYTFLYDTLESTYNQIRDHLRGLGVKCMVTGTSIGDWTRPPILNYNIENMNFTDKHAYKSHPNDYGFIGGSITSATSSTIVGGNEIFLYLPWMRAYNQPFLVGEWQICSPNPHVAELGLMMPAVASFQNWNMIQFDMLADYL